MNEIIQNNNKNPTIKELEMQIKSCANNLLKKKQNRKAKETKKNRIGLMETLNKSQKRENFIIKQKEIKQIKKRKDWKIVMRKWKKQNTY